jgi:hypothetical protein
MLGHDSDGEDDQSDTPVAHAFTFTVDGHTVSMQGGVGESELKKLAQHVKNEFKGLQSGERDPSAKRQGKDKYKGKGNGQTSHRDRGDRNNDSSNSHTRENKSSGRASERDRDPCKLGLKCKGHPWLYRVEIKNGDVTACKYRHSVSIDKQAIPDEAQLGPALALKVKENRQQAAEARKAKQQRYKDKQELTAAAEL